MPRAPRTLLLLLLLLSPALAQSREETFAFIDREIRSLETSTYLVLELSLSADGSTLTYRKRVAGSRGPDKGLVIPLKDVDIFCAARHRPDGYDRYDLKVRTRGRGATITYNSLPYRGTKNIVAGLLDARKAKGLDQAFNALIDLARGQKALFRTP